MVTIGSGALQGSREREAQQRSDPGQSPSMEQVTPHFWLALDQEEPQRTVEEGGGGGGGAQELGRSAQQVSPPEQ